MAVASSRPTARRSDRARGLLERAGQMPFLTSIVVSVLLAVLSAAVLPTVPSYDPWSWIVWGREVFDPHLSFFVGGGPSWKPLPFGFTTIYGLFGHFAPTLWVITARVGGILAVIAAYRLGSLLVRHGRGDDVRSWEPVTAGLLAAIGILLTQEWFYYMFRGTSEPMLVGLTLWAIDRHLAGRHVLAFILMVGASLIRPEWWPFVFLYGIWLFRENPKLWPVILVGWVLIPFGWFVPPWVSTGQPLLAASHAKAYNGHLGSDPFVEVLRRAADLQVIPSLVFAVVAIIITWFKERDRFILGLGAAALAWWVLVVAMTLDGYPGLERFFLPAAAVICVLGGVGVVRAARLVGDWAGSRLPGLGGAGGAGSSRVLWVAGGVAVLLVLVSIPFTISRVNTARAAEPTAARAVTRLNQLSDAVAAAGYHAAVYPCHSSFAAVNHGVQTALAWKLHVTLERVGTSMRHQGVMFVGPWDSIDGGPPDVNPLLTSKQLIAKSGPWSIYKMTQPGHDNPCVGH
jgi:hypothetical protein